MSSLSVFFDPSANISDLETATSSSGNRAKIDYAVFNEMSLSKSPKTSFILLSKKILMRQVHWLAKERVDCTQDAECPICKAYQLTKQPEFKAAKEYRAVAYVINKDKGSVGLLRIAKTVYDHLLKTAQTDKVKKKGGIEKYIIEATYDPKAASPSQFYSFFQEFNEDVEQSVLDKAYADYMSAVHGADPAATDGNEVLIKRFATPATKEVVERRLDKVILNIKEKTGTELEIPGYTPGAASSSATPSSPAPAAAKAPAKAVISAAVAKSVDDFYADD